MVKISEIIYGKKNIAITGHVNPDGDCIGSCLGLYNYLVTNYEYLNVSVYLENISDTYSFLDGFDTVKSDFDNKEFDVIFVLDSGDYSRIGVIKDPAAYSDMIVCIDHHISNSGYGDVKEIYGKSSSASEIVFELIMNDKGRINRSIAECLYTGIVQDTGVFKFSCTGSRTMEIAGILMDTGINFPEIVDRIFYEKSYSHQLLLAETLNRSELADEIISSYITDSDMQKCNAVSEDIEGIVNVLLNTKGALVSVFIYQKSENDYKVSLRSLGSINVSQVAVAHGGGGHINASGFNTGMRPEEIIPLLREEIKVQIKCWKVL